MTTENIFAGQSARNIRAMVASDPALAQPALAHYLHLLATRRSGLQPKSLAYAHELAFGEKAQTGTIDGYNAAAARMAAYKPAKRAKARKPQTEAKTAPAPSQAPVDTYADKAADAFDATMDALKAQGRELFLRELLSRI